MNQIITEIKDTKLFKEFEVWYNNLAFTTWDNNAFKDSEKDCVFFITFTLDHVKRMDSFIHMDFMFQKGVFEEFLVQKGYWVQWCKRIHEDGELMEMSFIQESSTECFYEDFELTFEEHLIKTFKECNTH